MPIPVLVAALAAGGSLVPHAAGGLIVTAASGYVAGTYLSATAVAAVLSAGAAAGVLTAAAAASAIIGSAGVFGTTIGASGLTGMLMSAGIISATPVAVPVGVALTVLGGGGYVAYLIARFKRKLRSVTEGEEPHFTELEARFIEAVIKRLPKDSGPDEERPSSGP